MRSPVASRMCSQNVLTIANATYLTGKSASCTFEARTPLFTSQFTSQSQFRLQRYSFMPRCILYLLESRSTDKLEDSLLASISPR